MQNLFALLLFVSSAKAFVAPRSGFARRSTSFVASSATAGPIAKAVDEKVISESNPLKVAIAGAGVGGLALANALCKNPMVNVTIYEQASKFQRFGGPIQLASNALEIIKLMDENLYGKVLEKFTFTGDKRNGIKDGIRSTWYAEFDLAGPAESRNMAYSGVIDRPDLQELYLESLPASTVHNGEGVVSYKHDYSNGGVQVELQSGKTVHADVLIGADGIWSAVRKTMRNQTAAKGKGSGAVYSGYTVFAGELDYIAPDHSVVGYKVYIGPQQYFVITDIGKGRYQWYAFQAREPNSAATIVKPDNSTSLYLQNIFTGWSEEIHDILRVTQEHEIEQRDLYDRSPSRPWYDGNVALLGDGIHAMMPNLGQGGCQAMEDAYVLSQELQRIQSRDEVKEALQQYQSRRFIRSAAVQGLSRFASDIIVRGFDTPAKIYWKDGSLQFENCNYAGVVTRMLQPILPVFFMVQFNFLYDGYKNDRRIDLPAAIAFALVGGLVLSVLFIEIAEVGIGAELGLGAFLGAEGATNFKDWWHGVVDALGNAILSLQDSLF